MTRKSINLLDMLKSVLQFFTENAQLLEGKPALQTSVEKLRVYINEIEALEKEQAKKAKTDTALKGETKTALKNAALKVLAGIGAHAAATNDTRLKMDSDITEYDLNRLRQNDLITEIHGIHDMAMEVAPQLITWHVMQPDIDALDTNSAAFDAKDPAIKNIKSRSKQATDDIKNKLNEAYNFTKDSLDAMMLPFKMVNPSAYGHYQNAREIIHIAGAHKKGTTPDGTETVK